MGKLHRYFDSHSLPCAIPFPLYLFGPHLYVCKVYTCKACGEAHEGEVLWISIPSIALDKRDSWINIFW